MPNAKGMSCLMPKLFCDAPLFVTMAMDVALTLAVVTLVVVLSGFVVTARTVLLSGLVDVMVTGTTTEVMFIFVVEVVQVRTVTGTVRVIVFATVTVDVTVLVLREEAMAMDDIEAICEGQRKAELSEVMDLTVVVVFTMLNE